MDFSERISCIRDMYSLITSSQSDSSLTYILLKACSKCNLFPLRTMKTNRTPSVNTLNKGVLSLAESLVLVRRSVCSIHSSITACATASGRKEPALFVSTAPTISPSLSKILVKSTVWKVQTIYVSFDFNGKVQK